MISTSESPSRSFNSGYFTAVGGDALWTFSYVRTTIAAVERLVTTRNEDPRHRPPFDFLESDVYEWIRPDSVPDRILNRRHEAIPILKTREVKPFDPMVVSYADEYVPIVRISERSYGS